MKIAGFAMCVLVAISAQSALADHCTSYSTSTNDFPEGRHLILTVDRFYVANYVCQPDCAFALFIYEESNGLAGLQRADDVVTDTCHYMVRPDTLVNF